jgi:lysozyme
MDTFRTHTLRLLLLLLCVALACPYAEARDKKKKAHENQEYGFVHPDKAANLYKAVPDSHPRQPKLTNSLSVTYISGNHQYGIDVSHYQGRIDWKSVSTDNKVGYVYLKATESNYMVDDTYEYNLTEARRHGLKVGSYHFFRPNVDAESQFLNFKRTVDRRKQDLLPLIDVEVTGGVPVATLHKRLQEFLRLVTKEYGKRPMIYTGRNFYDRYFAGYSHFKSYIFMIAQYTSGEPSLSDGKDFAMWQFTAKGRVNGIRGDVDRSRFVGRHSIHEILF